MGQILRYTAMALRAYTRDYAALFFSLFFPLIFMVLFGLLNLGSFGHVNVGIDDQAKNAESARFVAALAGNETLKVAHGVVDSEKAALEKGDRDLVIVIPRDFRLVPAAAGAAPTLTVYENAARGQQAGVGAAILTQVIDQLTFAVTRTAPLVAVRREPVSALDLKYVDFLTPGILGITIMNLGIASVAFAFVVDKQKGVLRRIMATPLSPRRFLAAQVLNRLVIGVLEVLILLAVAVFGFHAHLVGGLGTVLAVSVLGTILFLCLGFALTGVCETENQVAPLTQLITAPQMFLSGVFFGRDVVPAAIRPITDFLPLTFLNDALRAVTTSGATLWDVRSQLLGLLVWTGIGFLLAARFFRLRT